MQLYEIERDMLIAYLPTHAGGDLCHPDVEQGRVTEIRGDVVFVAFPGSPNAKGCRAEDLVWLK